VGLEHGVPERHVMDKSLYLALHAPVPAPFPTYQSTVQKGPVIFDVRHKILEIGMAMKI
jgi:hypothetical protein